MLCLVLDCFQRATQENRKAAKQGVSSATGSDSGACWKGPPDPCHVAGGLFKGEPTLAHAGVR